MYTVCLQKNMAFSPIKKCQQTAIWPPKTKYLGISGLLKIINNKLMSVLNLTKINGKQKIYIDVSFDELPVFTVSGMLNRGLLGPRKALNMVWDNEPHKQSQSLLLLLQSRRLQNKLPLLLQRFLNPFKRYQECLLRYLWFSHFYNAFPRIWKYWLKLSISQGFHICII